MSCQPNIALPICALSTDKGPCKGDAVLTGPILNLHIVLGLHTFSESLQKQIIPKQDSLERLFEMQTSADRLMHCV